jgi:hypothetical protein
MFRGETAVGLLDLPPLRRVESARSNVDLERFLMSSEDIETEGVNRAVRTAPQ